MEQLISVIVPVYNNKRELHTCVNSILRQTYHNLEIFLVDDGSTDGSGGVCDTFGAQDSRVRVIHQENLGPAAARNAALDLCRGEYIAFVDGDDWITEDYIAVLYEVLMKNRADIAVCNYGIYKDFGNKDETPQDLSEQEWHHIFSHNYSDIDTPVCFKNWDGISAMWYGDRVDTGAPMKLFRSSIWQNIRFPDCFCEDLAVMYRVFSEATFIAYTPRVLYAYRLRKTSVTRTFDEKKRVMISIARDLLEFGKQHTETLAAAKNKAVDACMHLICQMEKGTNKAVFQQAVDIIRGCRWDVLRDRKARKKTKYALLISFLGFDVVRFFYQRL